MVPGRSGCHRRASKRLRLRNAAPIRGIIISVCHCTCSCMRCVTARCSIHSRHGFGQHSATCDAHTALIISPCESCVNTFSSDDIPPRACACVDSHVLFCGLNVCLPCSLEVSTAFCTRRETHLQCFFWTAGSSTSLCAVSTACLSIPRPASQPLQIHFWQHVGLSMLSHNMTC